LIVSTDGGDSFHPATLPATGVTPLSGLAGGFPKLPGGTFRVITVPTACVLGQTVTVAWADFRQQVSRIYYALSNDGGVSWTTGPKGQPLLEGRIWLDPRAPEAKFQHFHPQIVSNPVGIIGCAFYEFGPKPTANLIDVIMAESVDGGSSFQSFAVTDQPWDPTVDAPWSHGDSTTTFIGDYFGLDASEKGFYPLWTDTRTGIQELWTEVVPAKPAKPTIPVKYYAEVAQILFGIIQDAPGVEIVGGHIIHVGPGGPPDLDILLGVACHRLANLVSSHEGRELQKAAMSMVARIAEREAHR
jgi:hypothetical protein